jgi:hypothetical protein
MPTPFTHLETAQRLLADHTVPGTIRTLLNAHVGAFLLGNVAPDARVGAGVGREVTHFYDYREGIQAHPWRVMLRDYPTLTYPVDAEHRAFLAGYVAHLSMDEMWSLHMVGPHFAGREWADQKFRFYMLHIILIYMDERDRLRIGPWQASSLPAPHPVGWLPFMPDDSLIQWQALIAGQIQPGGDSQTLNIFGGRIGKSPEEMREFLDSTQNMQAGLWDHVTPEILAAVEARMYDHAREQLICYMAETE